eukprot:2838603-Pyramimonas_sp.AAC.1
MGRLDSTSSAVALTVSPAPALPGRPRPPIDPSHYIIHSPKHPDCEICARILARNAPAPAPPQPADRPYCR